MESHNHFRKLLTLFCVIVFVLLLLRMGAARLLIFPLIFILPLWWLSKKKFPFQSDDDPADWWKKGKEE